MYLCTAQKRYSWAMLKQHKVRFAMRKAIYPISLHSHPKIHLFYQNIVVTPLEDTSHP